MKPRKTVVSPRSEYIMVRTTKKLKKQLEALAAERSLSLSLVGHLAFLEYVKAEMAREDNDDT